MNEDLRRTIQIFLTNCDKVLHDVKTFGHSDENLKYCYLFLEKSADLLQKVVKKDNQIINTKILEKKQKKRKNQIFKFKNKRT